MNIQSLRIRFGAFLRAAQAWMVGVAHFLRDTQAASVTVAVKALLTDAMAAMIGTQPFHAVTFDGARYDCGSKAGYIQANLAVALERPDMAAEVRAFAVDLLANQ